jgi:D-methionine transport system substrate-binding protein
MKQIGLLIAFVLSLSLIGCHRSDSGKTLKIAATSVPHAEILEEVKPDLKKEGIDLQIIVVEDYNTPNRALADHEVDANFFQHPAFLEQQIKDFGYSLEVLGAVHLEPMGLYSHKIHSLEELKEGSKAAVPSDPSNQARSLELMEKNGLIKLRRHDATTSVLDVSENPLRLKFVEIDSPLLARSLEDVDVAAITTNFALQGGLTPKKDALALEDAHSDYVNVIVVREGDSQRADLQLLLQALQSSKVRQYIEKHYKGAVVPAF